MHLHLTGGRRLPRCRRRGPGTPLRAARRLGRAAATALLLLPGLLGATGSAAAPGPETIRPADAAPSMLLVPPELRWGRLRLEVLLADPDVEQDVEQVVFYVDGQRAGHDRRRPFRLAVPAAAASARSLRAEAYGADGTLLAYDDLLLEDTRLTGPPFRVAITAVEPGPPGAVTVETAVSVPDGSRLDRLDLYLNETLATRLSGPPFRATLPRTDAGPDDYLRAVAHLDDGRSLEDARLVHSSVASERLDVCLVDLFAVVTDRWGEPVRGLGPDDFRVVDGERPLPVERFQEASEVPLSVGLLVDSSESMRLIMDEAKEAARTFLDRTLIPGDEAFLIDVDTVPRLVGEVTPSAGDPDDRADRADRADRKGTPDGEEAEGMGAAFADLEPGGTTALYDAILLGLLRLERHPGRRALVVLTDGLDFGSDFGPERCSRHARRAGVPIYVLSMAGLARERTNPRRNHRLDFLARSTGGRVLHVDTPEGFDTAYAAIDRELRSQYVLGVGSDRVLSDDALAGLTVLVSRPGARVRTARSRSSGRAGTSDGPPTP